MKIQSKVKENLSKHRSAAAQFAMEYIRRYRKPVVENEIDVKDEVDDNERDYYWIEEDEMLLPPSYEDTEAHSRMDTESTLPKDDDTVNFKILKHLERDLPPREISDFNILSHQEAFLRRINLSRNHFDDNEPLHKYLSCTKGEFSRAALELFQQCNMTKQNQKNFWNFISNSLGKVINLPVRANLKTKRVTKKRREECSEDLFADTTVGMTDEYCKQQKQNRFLEFCQCENDCILYVGTTRGKLFECPVCKEPRFRPCSRGDCQNNGKHDCEHLLYQDGIPYKTVLYRPIIHLIYELLENEYFECYLNFERFHQNDREYRDFMDGDAAKGHLKDMENYGENWKKQSKDRKDVTCVNLLMSQFYDSGQMFTSKMFDFWPLCIGFLNLPPQLRGKIGLGYFLCALFNGKHSLVERTLFTDILCEELRCLYYGIEHVVTDCFGRKKVYFIQARLIMHIMDTKAAEPIMGFQACQNSKFGCPLCHGITGLHDGKKCVFFGARNFLPPEHWLRFFGQTGVCCPAGFYDHTNGDQWRKEEIFWNLEEGYEGHMEAFFFNNASKLFGRDSKKDFPGYKVFHEFAKFMNKKTKNQTSQQKKDQFISEHSEEIGRICQPCDGSEMRKNELIQFLFHCPVQEPPPFKWFHEGEFSLKNMRDKISKNMWFRHADFREQKPYKRVSYSDYMMYASEAFTLNSERTVKKKSHINGIQGLWYFARLPYADLSTQFTWPFAHAVTGFIVRIVNLMLGEERKAKASSKKRVSVVKDKPDKPKMPIDTKMPDDNEIEDEVEEDGKRYDPYDAHKFRPQYKNGVKPPYCASKDSIEKISTWLNCVLLPTGLDDSWKINFVKPSSMKIIQKLKMISSFWDLIIDTVDIEQEYKLLFRMIAEDINSMLSYTIQKDKVDSLQDCVIESGGCWEGMVPPKETYFQVHQIIDLPGFIHLHGPPMGVSELPGERMLSMLKKRKLRVNSGGCSWAPYVFRNQMNHETLTARKFFSKKPTHLNRRTQKYVYNDRPFSICTNESDRLNTRPTLSDFEFEYLVEELIVQVQRVRNGVSDSPDSVLLQIMSNTRIPKQPNRKAVFQYVSDRKNQRYFTDEEVQFSDNILKFRPHWRKYATVYGVQFRSRGSKFREVSEPICTHNTLYVYNPSISTSKWHRNKEISCWFKCGKSIYGKLNSFFSVEELGDTALNGLLLASVTSFKVDTKSKRLVDRVYYKDSLEKIFFLSLQDIIPSKVAIIPFNAHNQSISLPRNKRYKLFTKSINSIHLLNCPMPEYYSMILLDKNKLSFFCEKDDERPFTIYI